MERNLELAKPTQEQTEREYFIFAIYQVQGSLTEKKHRSWGATAKEVLGNYVLSAFVTDSQEIGDIREAALYETEADFNSGTTPLGIYKEGRLTFPKDVKEAN